MNRILQTMLYGPQVQTRESSPETEERSSDAITDIGLAFSSAMEEAMTDWSPDRSVGAVYRAATIYSDTVASLHMNAHNENTGIRLDSRPQILRQPNPDETYHDTMSALGLSLFWTGNAYLLPMTRSRDKGVRSLILADPADVNVEWDGRRIFRTYTWRDQPKEHGQEIIHIALNRGPTDLKGVGPITAARLMLEGAKAEANFARKLFLDDASPNGALKIPQTLSKDEAEAILKVWESTHKGRKRPAILGGGADWQQMTLNPVDAQFIEERNFSVQEIGRFTGLPASFLLVSGGDSLTYSTTESLFRLWLTSSLNPTYLERIQQAFSRLLPEGEVAQFDTTELLKADLKARYESNEVAIEAGFKTVDEVRAEEGLPPLGGSSVPQE